jgi:CubicO group peptidase (beta-lactamase class C family)
MHEVMSHHVEAGMLPGLVTMVCRRGQVHVDTIGCTAVAGADGGREPMRPDTIFRITSMTKPITAVATMMLVEACRLRLDDPVDDLLPELAGRRVLTRPDALLHDTVPAERSVTVRDLLTFTSGDGLVLPPTGAPAADRAAWAPPINRAAAELELCFGPPTPRTPHDPDEWLRRLGTLPLACQPGSAWLYDVGAAVLGVLIARASGQPLDEFLRQNVFEPLGMRDTGFTVPAGDLDRLPPAYAVDAATGDLVVADDPADSTWATPPAFPNGANGLVSTADDLLQFGLMLLDGGRCGSERLLSRPTIEAMTTDQLSPAQKAGTGFLPGWWDSLGWGLGLAVVTRRVAGPSTPGRFGWDGGWGTSFWVDPAEDLLGVLLTQRQAFPQLSPLASDFWTSVYQAIDD